MADISKRQNNKLQRVNAILEVAERIFLEKGVADVTMDLIARESGMSKATLYVYFKSKDELFKEIAKKGHELLLDRFKKNLDGIENGADKVRKMGITFFEFAKEQPDYYRFLSFFEPGGPQRLQKVATLMVLDIVKLLESCIEEGIKDGSIRKHEHPAVIAKALWGMSSGMVQLITVKGKILQKETGTSPKQLIQQFFDLLEESIMTSPNLGKLPKL